VPNLTKKQKARQYSIAEYQPNTRRAQRKTGQNQDMPATDAA